MLVFYALAQLLDISSIPPNLVINLIKHFLDVITEDIGPERDIHENACQIIGDLMDREDVTIPEEVNFRSFSICKSNSSSA